MKPVGKCILLATAISVAGCASTPLDLSTLTSSRTDLATTAKAAARYHLTLGMLNEAAANPAASQELAASIDDDFNQVLIACQPVFSGYEREAQNLKWVSFSIAMIGTIAGAVIVPALSAATTVNKAAVAAVGGLSGAANSAQNALNSEGLTAADILATRNNIQSQFTSALSDYFAARPENDFDKEIAALEKARAACVAYAIETGAAVTISSPAGTGGAR